VIERLHIRDLAIVEDAQLEFGPGLNVLTGETGAGKSIVLGALGLLVGRRAAADTVRDGAKEASVEAIFRTDWLPELEAELAERGFLTPVDAAEEDGEEGQEEEAEGGGHELVVRRTVARAGTKAGAKAGRSRARVAGELVPVSTLAELFDGRIEISSQHSSQALLRPESHARYLDAAGELGGVALRVREHFEAVRELDVERADLEAAAEERARRLDFLRFQLNEIDEVGLAEGELEQLDRDHGRLAHAEGLRGDAVVAARALVGDDAGEGGAADGVATAERHLETMAGLDASLAPQLERVRSLEAELRDLGADVERYADGIESDPGRLAQLEERIQQVERLRRKYGQGEAEILAFRAEVAGELGQVEGADDRLEQIAALRAAAVAELDKAAKKLTKGREKAGRMLSKRAQATLAELDMPKARFTVSLEPIANLQQLPEGVTSGPGGAEAPEFRFSANEGEAPRSLQKVASGGELSRVFLSIKNALRPWGANMVLVFDEVDAGIGGRAAERVGRVLAELATEHQVLCITHLPQIAAFASTHFRVEKETRKGRTRTLLEAVEGDARVDEIARMAGGADVSDATRAHARALIEAASKG